MIMHFHYTKQFVKNDHASQHICLCMDANSLLNWSKVSDMPLPAYLHRVPKTLPVTRITHRPCQANSFPRLFSEHEAQLE